MALNIAHDLRTALLDQPSISDLTDTVYRNDVPDDEKPPKTSYIRIQRIRVNEDLTQDGYGGLAESLFTVDCIAPTQQEADDLADVVKTYLQSIAALLRTTTPTLGASTLRGLFVRDKADDYEPFPEASDQVIPFASMEVEIWHVP